METNSICKLCGEEREIVRSHIIPEFMFKPLYDKKGRAHKISSSKFPDSLFIQKGIREKLLCADCETKLSKWERYASQAIFHKIAQPEKYDDALIFRGINYKIYKLFQLSLLWRASIARDQFFHNVSLGPHEVTIRNMILEENPGETLQYCCMTVAPQGEESSWSDLIMMPETGRIGGHKIFWFVINGISWIFFVSNHTNNLPEQNCFLLKNGVLPIMWGPDNMIRTMMLGFVKANMSASG